MLTTPQIVVEKLTKNVNEAHLREIFGAYGPIKDIDLPMNRQCTPLSPNPLYPSPFSLPTQQANPSPLLHQS